MLPFNWLQSSTAKTPRTQWHAQNSWRLGGSTSGGKLREALILTETADLLFAGNRARGGPDEHVDIRSHGMDAAVEHHGLQHVAVVKAAPGALAAMVVAAIGAG